MRRVVVTGLGAVTPIGNDVPSMWRAAVAGEVAAARAINERLMPLHTKLFIEANPIAVKWGLATMGRIRNELRLPMTPLSAQFHDVVRGALRDAGAVA